MNQVKSSHQLKLGMGTRVIATGYLVPKMGNAANHYFASQRIPVWIHRVAAECSCPHFA